MGDSLKLFKDKRHRSSSSIAGVALESTLSERKLDIKASIPEGDDQFVIAEARCDDLQEKIDLVKILKKKRKLKKRSVTRIMEQHIPDENVPFISVRTQPKKKSPQHASKGYRDPDVVEQHRMISENAEMSQRLKAGSPAFCAPAGRPCGDGTTGTCGRGVQICSPYPVEPRYSVDETEDYSEGFSADPQQPEIINRTKNKLITEGNRSKPQGKTGQRRRLTKNSSNEEEDRLRPSTQRPENFNRLVHRVYKRGQKADRPVVELFNKNQDSSSLGSSQGMEQVGERGKDHGAGLQDGNTGPEGGSAPPKNLSRGEIPRVVRRLRYRLPKGYEMPTVASRMKQRGAYYYVATTNSTKIPFITSKSTAPSHNIGVNIQQVLNGLKTQQPPSGIPLTMAHNMGFRQCPLMGVKSSHAAPVLGNPDLNIIKLGKRILRLPIHKVSYNRLLELFRQGDGMVPRFLSGVSRPHYSVSECKSPDAKKYLFGMVNPSDLRASASTAAGGYHQSSNRLNAGDAMM